MNPATVVFGGSGFVGTHLVRLLHTAGARVVSVDIRPPREQMPGVEYHRADVRNLVDLTIGGPTSRIYNLAAVHTTPGHPFWEYYDTNVNGAIEVTRWATKHDVPEILFTSSISVYGPSEENKTEASPPSPESAYGYSKLMAERIHKIWFDAAPGRKLVIVRPAVVFGHGEGGNFTRLARLLQKGFFVYPGRKNTIKACVYVEDLLDSFEFALSQQDRILTYNAAYPQRYTLEQVIDTFRGEHFPAAKTYMVPGSVVRGAAGVLGKIGVFNMGIHPERVTKLIRSTDISPGVLDQRGYTFPHNLAGGLRRWSQQSQNTFN